MGSLGAFTDIVPWRWVEVWRALYFPAASWPVDRPFPCWLQCVVPAGWASGDSPVWWRDTVKAMRLTPKPVLADRARRGPRWTEMLPFSEIDSPTQDLKVLAQQSLHCGPTIASVTTTAVFTPLPRYTCKDTKVPHGGVITSPWKWQRGPAPWESACSCRVLEPRDAEQGGFMGGGSWMGRGLGQWDRRRE